MSLGDFQDLINEAIESVDHLVRTVRKNKTENFFDLLYDSYSMNFLRLMEIVPGTTMIAEVFRKRLDRQILNMILKTKINL